MDLAKREYFRGILLEEMRTLLGEAEKTVSEMNQILPAFPIPTNRATQESDRTCELRIRDRERKLIKRFAKLWPRSMMAPSAFANMCGCELSEARLKARPLLLFASTARWNRKDRKG